MDTRIHMGAERMDTFAGIVSKITGDLRSLAGVSREFVSARGPLAGGLGRGATDAHLAERRYQSRSDDWLYRSLRRYVLRGGGKSERTREGDGET